MPSVTLLADRGVRPLVFRPIPAGEFVMGSRRWHRVEAHYAREEPAHRVVVPRWLGHGPGGVQDLEGIAFWMAEVPVTQGQFDLWKANPGLGPGPHSAWYALCKDKFGLDDEQKHFFRDSGRFRSPADHPAEQVEMREALAYAEWLGQQAETRSILDTFAVQVFRETELKLRISLPSEALWEYACRAGTNTDYWSGDGEAALAEVGWYGSNSGGCTHQVAEKAPNPYDLFDMHGNVWEWCLDTVDLMAYRSQLPGSPPVVPNCNWRWLEVSLERAVRGGSLFEDLESCRSASRLFCVPSLREAFLGFRLCLIPSKGSNVSFEPSRPS
jgi:formylglycine-generating enzyme required for sulfatase activity